jgi:hypothetical protein
MWSLAGYRYVFIAAGLIGLLLFSLPSVFLFVRLPAGERFSDLYVLGPGHMLEDYPRNVSAGEKYLVYVDVENHLGQVAYYEVWVKLRNSSDAFPDDALGAASDLPVLYRYEALLVDGQAWEAPLTFSFADVSFGENVSSVGHIGINDALVPVNKTAVWDGENSGYFYWLIMELWLYDTTSGHFNFHSRFVTLRLNMTKS